MVEGPLGNIEIIGPRKLNLILLHSIIDEEINATDEENIIRNLNQSQNIVRFNRDTTFTRSFENGQSLMITTLSDEVEFNITEEVVDEMRSMGFHSISLAVGDPYERMEKVIRQMERRS